MYLYCVGKNLIVWWAEITNKPTQNVTPTTIIQI